MYYLTEEQYNKIAHLFPKPRGGKKYDNLTIMNAFLYVCKNGITWRSLPSEYGNWHTIYMVLNRWSRKEVLDTILQELIKEQIISMEETNCFSLDSTSIKVHPDGTGALKKRGLKQ